MKPGVGGITGEYNLAVSHADQVTRGLQRPMEVIEAYLVVLLLFTYSNHIVTEGHEGHMDGFDPAEQIRINRPGQNESVNQPMLLKNWRQIDSIRRRSWGIVKRGKQHVLFQAGGIGFDALQDTSVKGMKKIAVAEEKADHLCASFENPASLGIRAESEAPDGLKHSCARFPAYLSARIQDSRDGSDADGSGLGNVANGGLSWNCFHIFARAWP
jgi:hypothetical protein